MQLAAIRIRVDNGLIAYPNTSKGRKPSVKAMTTMVKILINPRHEAMIRALDAALKRNEATPDWNAFRTGAGLQLQYYGKGQSGPQQLPEWRDVSDLDLHKFVQLGLFAPQHYNGGFPTRYFLDADKISHLVESNFEQTPSGAIAFNISSPNSIVNVQSTLNNSTQNIQNAPSLADNDKHLFQTLIDNLKASLDKIPDTYADDIETVAVSTERLSEDLSRPKLNWKTIQVSADGLQKAAENIAKIAPNVLTAAQAILAFIAQLRR